MMLLFLIILNWLKIEIDDTIFWCIFSSRRTDTAKGQENYFYNEIKHFYSEKLTCK